MGTYRAFKRNQAGKYGAKRTELAGRSFSSAGEASCYQYLQAMVQSGEIRDLEAQVTVYLTRARVEMRPDFRFIDVATGRVIYAEFKGFETDAWRIKRRLWSEYGPAPLRVYKGRGRSLRMVEEITPPFGGHERP